jgi:hypothetical protein
MRSVVITIAAILVIGISQAKANGVFAFMSGNDLLRACAATDSYSQGTCYGYLEGVLDFQTQVRQASKLDSCLPEGIDGAKIKDAVVQFLRAHSAIRSYPAGALVTTAMAARWACPSKPKNSN